MHGRVQGVGFRAWTAGLARSLRLTGTVRNTENRNCVEIFVEGADTELAEFISAVKHEHPYAKVDSLEKNEVKPINFKRFSIEK